ncbi:MAG TPA: endonuclease MutS2 [Candidatus Ornithoclostridium excrementipullorum]|nr:endonuclease MutS2 [Candidatus Ornithoclostridium excrementipullorum]
MISEKTLKALEFDKIKDRAATYAESPSGAAAVRAVVPHTDLSSALDALEYTKEAYSALYNVLVAPSLAFDDVTDILKALEKQAVLSPAELLKIAALLRCSAGFVSAAQRLPKDGYGKISSAAASLYQNGALREKIESSIIGENEIADGASARLGGIRREIRDVNARIRAKLNSYVTGENAKYLQDAIVTVRGGRYVLPVRSEHRMRVNGLVHDRSASGATLFIEPFAVLEMNNDLKALRADEQNEIEAILTALSFEASQCAEGLRGNADILTGADKAFALAKYARATRSTVPVLNDGGRTVIKRGRHALIDPEKVVPIDVRLGGEFDILLITGPNTGGKTVTLKLVGLTSLMAASGFFVPCAEESELSVYKGIYCDIGDEQSIEQSLSTFSSHMKNLINITESVDNESLVLLDELGAGTDPAEGSALAIAAIEYLRSKKCRCIITTHYGELKEYSYTHDGIENASMDFDPVTFEPVYRLMIGVSGSSNAIKIARSLGLDARIADRAEAMLGDEKRSFDHIVASAENSRREAERLREESAALKAESQKELEAARAEKKKAEEIREKLEARAAKHSRELLSDYIEQADELIAQIKKQVEKGDEKALFEARRLKKKLENSSQRSGEEHAAPKPKRIGGDPQVGDRVYVPVLKCEATVVSADKARDKYTVAAGIMRTEVRRKDIERLDAKAPSAPKRRYTTPDPAYEGCPGELNVIGLTVDEALAETDRYLDRAMMSGRSEVRIVHGKGSGALRSAIRKYLSSLSYIKGYRAAAYGEGDSGATVVELK